MSSSSKGLLSHYDGVFLLDGVRTPFVEYNTALGLVSPTDLGIKAAREVFRRSSVPPADVDIVVAGNMAQASFDAYVLPRHIATLLWCARRSARTSGATRVRHWH